MKKRTILGIFVLIVLVASLVHAGTTGKIAGVVKDAESGDPLPGANVVLSGTQMGAASDLNGAYFIINVPPGVYELATSMIGYGKMVQQDVRVKIDQTVQVNFDLKTEVIAGEEITVVAERPVVEIDLTASKQVISGEQLMDSWITTVEEAVEIQSGVNLHGGVRGGFGLDVSYMVDGVEIRDTGSNSNFLVSNTSAIQEMEVLTGGYNAEYGNANGAIVNIVTKSTTQR